MKKEYIPPRSRIFSLKPRQNFMSTSTERIDFNVSTTGNGWNGTKAIELDAREQSGTSIWSDEW